MRTGVWAIVVVIIIIIGGVLWWTARPPASPAASSTTAAITTAQTVTTPQGITFSVPAAFALATGSEPIMISSYIPPCAHGYDYCIYKNDNEFAGTNFESAGIAITDRKDLVSQSRCLGTPPTGYDSSITLSATSSGTGYAVSVFANLGGAAAGNTAEDTDYRLWDIENSACTDLDERIATSDYDNYQAGSIQQFTDVDQAQVGAELAHILADASITVSSSSVPVLWPIPSPSNE